MSATDILGERDRIGVVVVGHVDHGKSTLIGRLLHETDNLPEGKLAELETSSRRRGIALEWSFVLDAFQAERDQAITIDTTQVSMRHAGRDYLIIDAPGHKEFLKNMISGAAQADAAVLVVDTSEGVSEQSRRHAFLLQMLGIGQVVVAVNKMDLAGFGEQRFREVRDEIVRYLGEIGLTANCIVPISAQKGDNLTARSSAMPWYAGETLLEALAGLTKLPTPAEMPLRLPVQNVYRVDTRRIIVGRIESGSLRVGDLLVFSPSNRSARVRTIESWPPGPAPVEVHAGQSVGITLDKPIFVERGDVASHDVHLPMLTHVFRAKLLWVGRRPLKAGASYRLSMGTKTAQVTVQSIDSVIDTDRLTASAGTILSNNDIAEVTLRSPNLLALDEYAANPAQGRFVLIEGFDTAGAGVINMKGYPDERHAVTHEDRNLFATTHAISADMRERRNGHRGAVVWLTGLSGAGKSTLAMEVEQRLFLRGYQAYVLDGDNVRRGLSSDLGFSPADRLENIRRIGEVAALFAEAGMIVITAFISPYISDRERARTAAKGAFHEMYIKADLATCESRDPKGLYRRARAGEIPEFTGISAPYEEPPNPELVVNTTALTIEQSVELVLNYIERQIGLQRAKRDVSGAVGAAASGR